MKGQKSDAIDCFIKIWNSGQSTYIGGRVQASEDRVHVSKTKKYGTIKGWTGVILGERGETVCLSVYDTENMNLKHIFDKFNSFWWMFWYTVSNSNAPSVVHQYHTSTTLVPHQYYRTFDAKISCAMVLNYTTDVFLAKITWFIKFVYLSERLLKSFKLDFLCLLIKNWSTDIIQNAK